MKALVTGGAGFIGSNLVDTLISQGNEVTVIDNESSDAHVNFYWNNLANNNKLDICDYNNTRELYRGVDVVFHMAAESRIQTCIENPIKATETNVLGTCTVLQCAREAGVERVIFSSTSAAYGLANPCPQKETMPTDCLNPYSVTKVCGEDICKMYYKLYGLKTIIFRYFNVYGNRQPIRGPYAPVIGVFLRQKKANMPMTIVGDGEQRRDFINVEDVVDANIKAAHLKCPAWYSVWEMNKIWDFGNILNIGSGKNYSVAEISNMIGGERVHIDPRPGEAKATLADASLARNILEWEPKHDLKKWIELNKD